MSSAGLAYSVSAFPHAYADVPILQLSAGLDSSKTIEAYQRMREIVSELRQDGPTESEVERARAYAAGARAIAFENSGAVARHAAQQTIVYREPVNPDRAIELLDEVTLAGRDRAGTRRSTTIWRSRSWDRTRPISSSSARRGRPARPSPPSAILHLMDARALRMRATGGLAVVSLLLAGCGGGGAGSPGSPSAHGAGAARKHGEAAAARRRVPAGLTRLRRELGRTLALAGASSGASVYDLTDRSSLFTARADVKRPPASVEKLYTTVALLTRLGPNARLHTTVLGTGHLGPGGVWHGDLYLRGDGDPTFGDGAFNRSWEFGYGPTASQLGGQLKQRGIRSVTGTIVGDDSLFDAARGGLLSNLAADIPDFGGQMSALTYDHGATAGALSPGAFAARQLASTLRAAKVRARAATTTGMTPRRAHLLAVVSSPRLATLLSLMNIPSDDLFAELLTKQLGVRFGRKGTIAAGARVISRTISAYGLHPRILDGSGLSRNDRSSPAEVVALLRSVWQTDVGHVLSRSLPALGVNGTVRRIGVNTAAQGHCIAKTGTLTGVTNLAGYCRTGRRHMIAFTILLDGPTNERGIVLLSRMTAAIARY